MDENGIRITHTSCVRNDDEIIALAHSLPAPLTIAIDAPTVVPNETGMRDCERQLQAVFGRNHAGPYPGNRTLLGKANGGIPRGVALSARMQSELGAVEGLPAARHVGVAVMEVFPAPAIVRLFQLDRALIYKKKRGRTWDLCRAGLCSYLTSLAALSDPSLTMAGPTLGEEKGVALKRIEDQTDAVLCAYLAGLAWLFGEERLEAIGTIDKGYIVVPRQLLPCVR